MLDIISYIIKFYLFSTLIFIFIWRDHFKKFLKNGKPFSKFAKVEECILNYHVKDCYASSFTRPCIGNEISANLDDNIDLSEMSFRNEELNVTYFASISGVRFLGLKGSGGTKEISFIYKAFSIGTNIQNIIACF